MLPTASALDRVMTCVASATLPHVRRETLTAASHGIAVHAFLERARVIGRDAALAEVPEEHRHACAVIPLDQLPAGGSLEIALAWDYTADVGRALVTNGRRDYSGAQPTEYVGTADYVGVDGDSVVVVDYKTGYRTLARARDSWQLRMLALAAARMTGKDSARVAFAVIHDDDVRWQWDTLDAMDLGDAADALVALAVRIEAGESTPVEGSHCTYCPAFDACPAKKSLVFRLGNGGLQTVEQESKSLTDDIVAKSYLALERYDEVVERIRGILRQRAERGPLDLGDGRVYGPTPWKTTKIDADTAYNAVREACGNDAAERAFPRSATLSKIKSVPGAYDAAERAGAVDILRTVQIRAVAKKGAK